MTEIEKIILAKQKLEGDIEELVKEFLKEMPAVSLQGNITADIITRDYYGQQIKVASREKCKITVTF